MNEALNNSIRAQTDAICQTIGTSGFMDSHSRPVTVFNRATEIETDFYADEGAACCGLELNPFWTDDGRFMGVCHGCGQKYKDTTQVRYKGPWIGVDLDGTLAHDLGGGNRRLSEIGSPIKPMVNRVKKWVADGKTVKIFTARASSPRQVAAIKKWLLQNHLPDLEVTNAKDLRMIELWDDRCVQVTTNMGEPVTRDSENKKKPRPTRVDAGRQGSFSGLVYRLKILLAF